MQQIDITPANISDEVADAIRNMILDGALEPGARINEVHLARELGVSRTPLREAVARLVSEQTLVSVPRIGAFVKPLTIDELEQIYPIRALLDPEALRLAGIPLKPHIDRLDRLNARLAKTKNAENAIWLDDEWHLMLVANCPNLVLLELIRDFMRRTRRYELGLMRDRRFVAVASDDHDAIIAALRRSDIEGAIIALRRNLTGGLGPIREWLATRKGDSQ